jgi:hypothetical protein
MTTSRFVVITEAPNTATRPNGVAAREKLKAALSASGSVIVDMHDIVLTPSFADEFLGVLLAQLGDEEFRRSVRIENVPPTAASLLRTVLHRRAQKPPPEAPRILHA